MLNPKQLITLPAVLILLSGTPYLAAAQGAAPPAEQPPGQQPPPASDLDQQTKKEFAEIYKDIQNIRSEYSAKLQEAEGQERARALQQEAQNKMAQAVEEHGMSVSRYNELANVITKNPELLAEIKAM